MNFYKAETIKAGVKISQYLTDQGIKMQGGRAVAAWRDGSRMSVSINDEKGLWHDFVNDEGGDIIKLFIKIEGGDFIGACRELGDRYHLAPTKGRKRTARKARPAPNWVRVSWLVINGNDDAHMSEAYEHLNAGGDWPTNTDLVWARRVARLLDSDMIGSTLDVAMTVAGQLYLANEGMTVKKETK